MLSEPAMALTDLVLGVVAVRLTGRLRRAGAASAWCSMFAWVAAGALAGFVHHGFVTHLDERSTPSFVAVTAIVVVALSYLAAASIHHVFTPGRRPAAAVWSLRLSAVAAYLALAASGRHEAHWVPVVSLPAIVVVVVVWVAVLRRGDRLAVGVLAAFALSAAAAAVQALPADARVAGLDPVSLYHLLQIPGLWLLAAAVRRDALSRADSGPGVSESGEPFAVARRHTTW